MIYGCGARIREIAAAVAVQVARARYDLFMDPCAIFSLQVLAGCTKAPPPSGPRCHVDSRDKPSLALLPTSFIPFIFFSFLFPTPASVFIFPLPVFILSSFLPFLVLPFVFSLSFQCFFFSFFPLRPFLLLDPALPPPFRPVPRPLSLRLFAGAVASSSFCTPTLPATLPAADSVARGLPVAGRPPLLCRSVVPWPLSSKRLCSRRWRSHASCSHTSGHVEGSSLRLKGINSRRGEGHARVGFLASDCLLWPKHGLHISRVVAAERCRRRKAG